MTRADDEASIFGRAPEPSDLVISKRLQSIMERSSAGSQEVALLALEMYMFFRRSLDFPKEETAEMARVERRGNNWVPAIASFLHQMKAVPTLTGATMPVTQDMIERTIEPPRSGSLGATFRMAGIEDRLIHLGVVASSTTPNSLTMSLYRTTRPRPQQ